jgi:hypothetical protein
MVAISFACFRWQATDSPDGVGSWLSGIAGCQCEGSGTGARLGARPGPASRTSVSPSNLAWRRESRTFRSAPFTTSHQPVLRIRPESPRSTSDRRSEVLRGATEGLRGYQPAVSPRLGSVTLLPRQCRSSSSVASAMKWGFPPKTAKNTKLGWNMWFHAACTLLARSSQAECWLVVPAAGGGRWMRFSGWAWQQGGRERKGSGIAQPRQGMEQGGSLALTIGAEWGLFLALLCRSAPTFIPS